MEGIKSDTIDRDKENSGVEYGLAILVFLLILGLWGIACLVAGISQEGGLMAAVRGWLEAVALL